VRDMAGSGILQIAVVLGADRNGADETEAA
jgi:hypothetical protein